MSISSVVWFGLTLGDDVILLFCNDGDASGDSMSVKAELSETARGAGKERTKYCFIDYVYHTWFPRLFVYTKASQTFDSIIILIF